MSNSTDTEIHKRAKSIFDAMSIEERVGQLFILAFPGKNPEVLYELIDRYGIAGCYISQDNAETFDEARALTETLQARAAKKQAELPLILGVDQEGAWGVLIPEATIGPGNLALGRAEHTDGTRAMYRVFAKEMASVGYQAILAPCADINLNPNNPIIGMRSFGEKADRVAAHVSAAVEGIHSEGVLAAAKHFPGHGDTSSDTHRDMPVVDKPLDVLFQQELLPFQAAINAGVDMIMTSHILFPQVDPDNPATLSATILSDILRHKMKFEGLVITDSMNMGAIRKHYSSGEASVKAFIAGADLIMLSEEHYDHDYQYLKKQIASIQSIIDSVNVGSISPEVLQDRVLRVIKKRLQLQDQLRKQVRHHVTIASIQENKIIEEQAAQAAVHIVRDKCSLFPLDPNQSFALINTTPQSSYANLVNPRGIGPNQRLSAFASFAEAFKPHSASVFLYEDLQDNVQEQLNSFDVVIAVSEDYPLPGEDFEKAQQQECLRNLIEDCNEKLLLIGLRSAYELEHYPKLQSYVCTYSSRTCAAISAAKMLFKLKTG